VSKVNHYKQTNKKNTCHTKTNHWHTIHSNIYTFI